MRSPLFMALVLAAGCTSVPEGRLSETGAEPGRPSPLKRLEREEPEQVPLPAPKIFSLLSLLELADESPALAAAKAKIARETGTVVQEDLLPNPVLTLETEMMPVDDMGFGNARNKVLLSQRIETAGKARTRVHAALARRDEAEALYFHLRSRLLADVAGDYSRAHFAGRKAELAVRIHRLNKELLELAEELNRTGRLSDQELIPHAVAVENAEAERLELEAEERKSLRDLEGRLGLSAGTILGVEALERAWTPPAPEQAFKDLLSRNSELILLDRGVAAARAGIDAKKSVAYPDVTVGVGYIRGAELSTDRDDFLSAFLQVPLPVFNRNQGSVANAEALLREACAELEGAAYRVLDEWYGFWERQSLLASKRDLYYSRIIPLLEQDIALKQRQVEAGRLSMQASLQSVLELEKARTSALEMDETLALIKVEMCYLAGAGQHGN